MRRSQTELAVLGALSVEPMSGYAVREAIRDVLGHFWSESYGQIYPKLSELLEEGLISRSGIGRTGSSVYAITGGGEVRLGELLQEPIQTAPPRNGLMLRLFFGRHLGPEACSELLRQARMETEERLVGFAQIRAEIDSEEASEDHPYFLLTVDAGEHGARAMLDWIDGSLATLGELKEAG